MRKTEFRSQLGVIVSEAMVDQLRAILGAIPFEGYEYLATQLSLADALVDAQVSGKKLSLSLEFGMPIGAYAAALQQQVENAVKDQFEQVELHMSWQAASVQAQNQAAAAPGVKNIVAVASGKGGVGKSTTSANLALALAKLGAKVGVLDADIYGPSQAHMLGISGQRPEMHSPNQMLPIPAINGVKVISMGNLVTEKTPMVWRGPMVSGALQQLLNNTYWEDIDYLIIDMPPGTGDIQLTLSQTVPVSGSVIVTTPQDIALLDAKKGIEMFEKVNIPVLGLVENMSTHICTQCGHEEAIFGTGGGDKLSADYGVPVLGRLPLTLSIREQTDAGKPPVAAEPGSEVSKHYLNIAQHMCAALWASALQGNQAPSISMSDD